ncbi:MAG: hypothetical protein ACOY93_22925 [Bacillota bacterium]
MAVQVRVRFLREGEPVEPEERELRALAGRYLAALAGARFGEAWQVRLADPPAQPKPESLA